MGKDLRSIVEDNEQAAADALSRGDCVQAFLLVHVLVESLLRTFLKVDGEKEVRFSDLIKMYNSYLESEHYPSPAFVDDLTKLNRRRNRIVHRLWKDGFSLTNSRTEGQAHAAVFLYGLFIEWLETFDKTIIQSGFQYLKPDDPISPEEMAELEKRARIVAPHLSPGSENRDDVSFGAG